MLLLLQSLIHVGWGRSDANVVVPSFSFLFCSRILPFLFFFFPSLALKQDSALASTVLVM